jgi:hypothetical protein
MTKTVKVLNDTQYNVTIVDYNAFVCSRLTASIKTSIPAEGTFFVS